jgi:hypothetical protein
MKSSNRRKDLQVGRLKMLEPVLKPGLTDSL